MTRVEEGLSVETPQTVSSDVVSITLVNRLLKSAFF